MPDAENFNVLKYGAEESDYTLVTDVDDVKSYNYSSSSYPRYRNGRMHVFIYGLISK
ncbi:7697_t:CDS:2, partial [Entrophospora sp. SA101]